MKVTVLGSGTSTGVPIIGCPCSVCHSTNPKNHRLRSSVWIEAAGKSILIDTSPDLRQQALMYNIKKIDAVLYTHEHADHVHGIDELRIFNALQEQTIPVFGTADMMTHLQSKFSYIFPPKGTPLNKRLVPQLTAYPVAGHFDCLGVDVTMIPCNHGANSMTANYRIGNFAWLTDTNGVPADSIKLLKGLEVLFLDGLRPEEHPTHFNLEQSLAMARTIAAQETYLIHLAHNYEHDDVNASLPEGIQLAYDGLAIEMTY